MDNANNYTSKIPATQPKAPSQKTKEKRAQLLRQPHTRSFSLNVNPPTTVSLKKPGKPVKTEAPAKTSKLEWTDKMRGRLNVLLAKLNAGETSSIVDDVGGIFGKRGYQHGDRQVIAKAVSEQSPDRQQNIANHTDGLLKKIDDPLTVAVLTDILAAAPAPKTEEHPLLFIPQDPSKASLTLAKSGPPTVTKGKPIPANPLSGHELRSWYYRGEVALKKFLDALGGTDAKAKLKAFYGASGLHTVLKEVTDLTNHPDVEELDEWLDRLLNGRSRQDITNILRSIRDGFDAQGSLYEAVCRRLIAAAKALLKKMDAAEADWHVRGAAQTEEVVAALLTGDTRKLKNAFYDPGYGTPEYGKNPKLYDTIKQRIGNNDPAQQRASYDRWVGKALKGCSIDDLDTIWNTIEANVESQDCTRGGVFGELERALLQNIYERKEAEQFFRTVLTKGDIDSAAHSFEMRVKAITRDDSQLMHARMSALIAENLEKLSSYERSRLKERCADLDPYPAVTALRGSLGMSDPKAIDNLFVKLKAGDLSGSRAAFRLAEDQLRLGTRQEIEMQIKTALKGLTVQQTLAIAKTYKHVRVGEELDRLLLTQISSTVSAVVPAYFLEEYLIHGREPFDALEVLEDVVVSSTLLNSNSPGRVNEALGHSIAQALRDLTDRELDELTQLDWSKASKEIADAFREQIGLLIGQRKEELANKYLLPKTPPKD